MDGLTWSVALQMATAVWWLFVGALSLAALAIIGLNLRGWNEKG